MPTYKARGTLVTMTELRRTELPTETVIIGREISGAGRRQKTWYYVKVLVRPNGARITTQWFGADKYEAAVAEFLCRSGK